MALIVGRLTGILELDDTRFRAGIASASRSMASVGRTMMTTGRQLSTFVTLPLVGVGVAAVKTAADFERTMNTMRAVAGVPQAELGKLRDLAVELGAKTVFSANDAAGAMLELSKAGISTADIMGGALRNTLDLATAGDLDLARAATIAANAMNVFGLSGRESQKAVDALAGAANASSADVDDLALALQMGGNAAASAGLSIQETTGVLAALADQGIRGSDAGTSLKTMLLNLVPTSKKAKDTMSELGVSFVNSEGSIKSITQVARILQERLGGLSQAEQQAALKVMFGTDAYRAARIVMDQGATGLREYMEEVSKTGTAHRVAVSKMEGLPGVIETLKGSIETFMLVVGDRLKGAIAGTANVIIKMAEVFTSLPRPMQNVAVAFGGIAAAAGPLLFILGGIAQGSSKIAAGLDLMTGPARAAAARLTALQAAAALSGVEMSRTAAAATLAKGAIDAFLARLALVGSVTAFATAIVGINVAFDRVEESARKTETVFDDLAANSVKWSAGFAPMHVGWENLKKALGITGEEADKTGVSLARLMDKAVGMVDGFQGAAAGAAAFQKKLGEWGEEVKGTLNDVSGIFSDFADKAKVSAEKAVKGFTDRLKDLRDFKSNVETLIKRGISEDVLQDLVANAESGGAQFAAGLVKGGKAAVKAVNEAASGIDKTSAKIPGIVEKYVSRVPGAVEKHTGRGRSAGFRLGDSITSGIAEGIRQGIPAIDAWADAAARAATITVEKRLESNSPSRVFMRIGEDVVRGFLIGLETIARVFPRFGGLVEKMIDRFTDGIADQVDRMRDRTEREIEKLRDGLAKKLEDEKLSDAAAARLKASTERQIAALRDLTDSGTSALRAMVAEHSKAAKRLLREGEQIARRFDKLKADIDDFRGGVESAFSGFGNLGDYVDDGTTTIAGFFARQAAQAREFGRVLQELGAAGASPELLRQVLQGGPEMLPFAKEILAGGSDLVGFLNDQLSAIGDAMAAASDALTEQIFGDRIDEMRSDIDAFTREVDRFSKALQADAVRTESTKVIRALAHLTESAGDMAQRLRRMAGAAAGGGAGRQATAAMQAQRPVSTSSSRSTAYNLEVHGVPIREFDERQADAYMKRMVLLHGGVAGG